MELYTRLASKPEAMRCWWLKLKIRTPLSGGEESLQRNVSARQRQRSKKQAWGATGFAVQCYILPLCLLHAHLLPAWHLLLVKVASWHLPCSDTQLGAQYMKQIHL
jgi:hypothetical protein